MNRIISAIALVAMFSPAISISEGREISFNEIVREAILESPAVGAIDATLSERAAEAFAVAVPENPQLDLDAGVPSNRSGSQTEYDLTISQAIRPGDFGARAALARLIEETAEVDKGLALNEFIQNLRLLYAQAWQSQETERLYEEAGGKSQQVFHKISAGATKGIFPEGDLQLFTAELTILEAESIAAAGYAARAKSELTQLSGMSLKNRALQRADLAPTVSREEFEDLVRTSKLPTQNRETVRLQLAEKQLEVARKESFPTFSPRLGYGRTDDETNQILIGVTVPLPFFNRNQADTIRAQGALMAAERNKRYANSDALVSEALLLFDAAAQIRRQIELYDSRAIPAKQRALDAYSRQFDAGSGTAFQIWQAQRELNDTKLRSLELATSLTSLLVQLNALAGSQIF